MSRAFAAPDTAISKFVVTIQNPWHEVVYETTSMLDCFIKLLHAKAVTIGTASTPSKI